MTEAVQYTDARKHIRGSSLLLSGRFISLGINFLVQVVTVRYLAKSDYGAFAYALTLASIGSSIVLLSMDKAISRFLPIYEEQGDEPALRGGMLLTLGTILGLSLAMVLLIYGLRSLIADHLVSDTTAPFTRAFLTTGLRSLIADYLVSDTRALAILLITIWLAPVGAIDNWFQSIFAVFASPKAIFFRRYIVGPGLKLVAVLLVILAQADVMMLAVGYVVGGFIGILAYAAMLHSLIRRNAAFQNWFPLRFPFRDIYGFSVPLMYSDVVFILRNNAVIILIEYFHNSVGVADYRAVVPLARLNEIVLQSFTFLYTPLAARLYAKRETQSINELYWQTALWILVFSFPIFSLTFSLAQPITVFIFEERYANSGLILAILTFGYYFNAALGFNNHTLRVYGVIKYILIIDIVAACAAIILGLVLVPRYGAMGGAFTATGTLVIHNLLNHLGLLLHTDIELFNWKYLKSYVMVIIGAVSLLVLQITLHPPIYIGIPAAALVSMIILRLNRRQLRVVETFPELLKIAPMRMLLEE